MNTVDTVDMKQQIEKYIYVFPSEVCIRILHNEIT